MSQTEVVQGAHDPREVEAFIKALFEELLRVENVTADDNLLLLGGESLIATQIISRIRDRYAVEVSLRSVLVDTIVEIVAEIVADLEFKQKAKL